MAKKNNSKMMKVWFLTDIIIVICSILLLMEGGTIQNIIGIFGVLLIISEIILYKKGYLFK